MTGLMWFLIGAIAALTLWEIYETVDRGVRKERRRRAAMLRWRGAVPHAKIVGLLLLPLLLLAGCASNDPNAVLNAVDDAADIAQVSVILFTDPGPNQTKLLDEIAKARAAADLPALRRIISHFNGTPATRPTV